MSKAIENLEAAQRQAMAIRPKVGGFPSAAGPWTVPFGNSIVPSPRQLSQEQLSAATRTGTLSTGSFAPTRFQPLDKLPRTPLRVLLSVATVIGDGSRLEIDVTTDHARTP